MHNLIEAVRQLPDHWCLVPLGGQKYPIFSGWQDSRLKKADFEEALTRGHFNLPYGDSNELPLWTVKAVGVLCGEPSGGLVFIDHDGETATPKLEDLAGQPTKEAMPKTPLVTSGRPCRWQAICQVPPDMWPAIATKKYATKWEAKPDGRSVPCEGLEFRWTGCQSVVVGAHPDTNGYRWIYDPATFPTAQAPDWAVIAMLPDQTTDEQQKALGHAPMPRAFVSSQTPSLVETEAPKKRTSATVSYYSAHRDFSNSFSLPCGYTIPLEVCASPQARQILDYRYNKGRNDSAAALARELIGVETYLTQLGQSVEGSAHSIFMAWCVQVGLDKDKPHSQPQTVWKSALKDKPTPSLPPDKLEKCAAAWVWREQIKPTIQKPAPLGPADVVAPPEELDEATPETLRAWVKRWHDESDPFQRFFIYKRLRAIFGHEMDERRVKSLADALAAEDAKGNGKSLQALAEELFSEMEQTSSMGVAPGVPTGFRDLDGLTGGLQPQEVILCAGRPGMGKTAFVTQIALNVASQGKRVIVFSLEMSKKQMTYRMLSAIAKIPAMRMQHGKLDDPEWDAISSAMAQVGELPITINDNGGQSSTMLEDAIKEMAEPPDLVIVDYIGLMFSPEDRQIDRVSALSASMKRMAKRFDCPFIVLSQLSRGVESRNDKRPMNSDLRDSGSLEQDANMIWMLYRDEYYNPGTPDRGIAEVIVTKHRNGPTGTVKLLFDGQYTSFRSLS